MNPETPIIRQNVLNALLRAERPLTTFEVCDRAGRYTKLEPCNRFMHGVRNDTCYFVRCNRFFDTFLMHLNSGQRGLRELKRFEKLEEVIGYRESGRRTIMWVHAKSETMTEIALLEEIFTLPSNSNR